MKKIKRAIPIRIKILISLLLVVTFVVSIITYTMVGLFQKDKTTYVVDLTSFMAQNMASETDILLRTYRDQIIAFGRVLVSEDLPVDRKTDFVKAMFQDFQDFISISMFDETGEKNTVFDARILEASGVTPEMLADYRARNPVDPVRLRQDGLIIRNAPIAEKLPGVLMAVPYGEPGAGSVYLAAIIRAGQLMELQTRSQVFDSFLVDADGIVLSHKDPRVILERVDYSPFPVVQAFLKERLSTKTMEFMNDGRSFLGAYAKVDTGGLAVIIQIPKNAAFLTARELINRLLTVAFAILAVSALTSLFWSHRLTRPIERLFRATREIGKGKFDVKVQVSSQDEIGQLAGSFNQMAEELKGREEALKQAQAALIQSEKMAAFGQLGAGIAHEVKNPLAGILGYAQLAMRKVEAGSPTHNHLQIIEKETRRCKTIIENLMKFARQEKTEFSVIDLNRVAEDAVAIVDHQLTINKVTIEKNLAPLPSIKGNANQLQQVLMNLMINAQQAMEPNGGKVMVSSRALEGSVELSIEDTGPGIPPEIQAKIFEPFFTTKPPGKGTGLGLSVTYGIIKDHNGQVKIKSEVGRGAAFILLFPTAPSAEGPRSEGNVEAGPGAVPLQAGRSN